MRTTAEIICAVKERQPVTLYELIVALLAMESLEHFANWRLRKLSEAVSSGQVYTLSLCQREAQQWAETRHAALNQDAETWVGLENLPGHPDFDRRYAAGLKLVNQLIDRG